MMKPNSRPAARISTRRERYKPLELDAKGKPLWQLPIPYEPEISSLGYELPFVHPALPIVRPPAWTGARWTFMIRAFLLQMPVALFSGFILHGLHRSGDRAAVLTSRLSISLQKKFFGAITRYQDPWSHNPVQVSVMFPGEPAIANPVDVGILEPVMVLHAIGRPTRSCCEGHGKSAGFAYIGLESGYTFPPELLDALKSANVPYELENKGHGETLHAKTQDSNFAEILRKWARATWDAHKIKQQSSQSIIPLPQPEKATQVQDTAFSEQMIPSMHAEPVGESPQPVQALEAVTALETEHPPTEGMSALADKHTETHISALTEIYANTQVEPS